MVDIPYDWDDYASDFKPSSAYVLQEQALRAILSALPVPASVLEVGPGFGRVTKILTQLWPSEVSVAGVTDDPASPTSPTFALTKFALSDLSEAAIEQTSVFCPGIDFTYEINALQDRRPFPRRTFDLVVAIEVLLHIRPDEVQKAIDHLLAATNPKTGALITCDWTQALPLRPDGSPTPIRNQNFRHDYADLFAHSKPPSSIVAAIPTGLQTIFVVSRKAA